LLLKHSVVEAVVEAVFKWAQSLFVRKKNQLMGPTCAQDLQPKHDLMGFVWSPVIS